MLILVLVGGVVQMPAQRADAQTQITSGATHSPVISSDGSRVAFVVEQIPSGRPDIYLRDLRTGILRSISAPAGAEPNGGSYAPAISADGRFVTFESEASNLVLGDTNGQVDVFVRNTDTGTTTRVSVSTQAQESPAGSFQPSISADGRFITFHTRAGLDPADTNSFSASPVDVYVRDTVLNTTKVVSTDASGAAAGRSSGADISSDGSFLCFQSESTALAPGDVNGVTDVFVRSLSTGTTSLASMSDSGTPANGPSGSCSIAKGARPVAFSSTASNLVADDTNGRQDVFARDVPNASTTRISTTLDGEDAELSGFVLSDDGSVVGFVSRDSFLVGGDNNGLHDMFVKNLPTGSFYRASVSSAGAEADNQSTEGDVSGDGRMIAFAADANNLSSGDGWLTRDVFVHDRVARTTQLVSQGGAGPNPGNGIASDAEAPDECHDLRVCLGPVHNPVAGPVSNSLRELARQLPRTPKNQVLVVNANVIQAYATPNNPTHSEDCGSDSKTCRSNARELNFAERIDGLSRKTRGPLDGMAAPPDIILLQEVRTSDLLRNRDDGSGVTGIAAHLKDLTGYTYKIAVSDDHPEISAEDENGDGRVDTKVKSDGAILYNAATMLKRGVSSVTSTYDKETEGCPQDPLPRPADVDRDGEDDCEYAKHKRNYLAQFVERKPGTDKALSGGLRIAVANIHFVTPSHLKGGNQSLTHETAVDRWTQEVVNALHGEFPVAETYMMGGDWNAERCLEDPDPSAPQERATCAERLWWSNAEQDGFVDDIYALYGSSDETLSNQYRDGCDVVGQGSSCSDFHHREKRIDFVFHEDATVLGASHDLTCGIRDRRSGRAPNCDDLLNHDRYSDHRLVWTLLQG